MAADSHTHDYCQARDIRLLAYSPLLMVAYTHAERALPPQHTGPDSDQRLAMLRQVAAEVNATPNQVVLAWLMPSQPSFRWLIPVAWSNCGKLGCGRPAVILQPHGAPERGFGLNAPRGAALLVVTAEEETS